MGILENRKTMTDINSSIQNILSPVSQGSDPESKEVLMQRLAEVLQHNEQLEKGIAYFRSKVEERHLEQKEGLNTV